MSKSIGCPNCTNKRLFDVVKSGSIEVAIKCPRCRKVINLIIANNTMEVKAM